MWDRIEGVEVHVTKILFTDATVWTPPEGVDLNDNYDKEMERRDKVVARRMEVWRKKWNREHPDNQMPQPKNDNGDAKP
jgi:hypothetical protein